MKVDDFLKYLLEENEKENIEVYEVITDNKMSLGRPINDPVLANMKYRAEASAEEAQGLLHDLKISKVTGKDIYDTMNYIYNEAAKDHTMSQLLHGSKIIKNRRNNKGVLIKLKSIWLQDEKKGKRSYGYIRALLIAAVKANYIRLDLKEKKYLRIEMVENRDELILYISKKSKSWNISK